MISYKVSIRCLDASSRTFNYSVPQEARGTVRDLISRIGEQHYSSPLSVSLVKNETLDQRYLGSEELPETPSEISIYLQSRNVRRRIETSDRIAQDRSEAQVTLHLSMLESGMTSHICTLTMPCPSQRVWLDWIEELQASDMISSRFRFHRLQSFPSVEQQELSLTRQVTPGIYKLTMASYAGSDLVDAAFRPFSGQAYRLS